MAGIDPTKLYVYTGPSRFTDTGPDVTYLLRAIVNKRVKALVSSSIYWMSLSKKTVCRKGLFVSGFMRVLACNDPDEHLTWQYGPWSQGPIYLYFGNKAVPVNELGDIHQGAYGTEVICNCPLSILVIVPDKDLPLYITMPYKDPEFENIFKGIL